MDYAPSIYLFIVAHQSCNGYHHRSASHLEALLLEGVTNALRPFYGNPGTTPTPYLGHVTPVRELH